MIDLSIGEFLAVDPSIRSAGVAVFRGGCLAGAGTVKLDQGDIDDPAQRCLCMAQAIVRWAISHEVSPRALVLEWPQVYRAAKSKGDPNDLIGLSGVGMAVAGILSMGMLQREQVLEVVAFTPAEWCGQLPKTTRKSGFATSPKTLRIRSRLTPDELEAIAGIASHDAMDAIGLGLHALDRMVPRRVFPGAT